MKRVEVCVCMLAMILVSSTAEAQRKVESGTYNLMLKALLKENVPEVGAKEARKEQLKYQFIDSREKREYEVSHIKNAIWVGYDDFDTTRLKEVAKDQQIIVYCAVGARSEKIANK